MFPLKFPRRKENFHNDIKIIKYTHRNFTIAFISVKSSIKADSHLNVLCQLEYQIGDKSPLCFKMSSITNFSLISKHSNGWFRYSSHSLKESKGQRIFPRPRLKAAHMHPFLPYANQSRRTPAANK
jgi:hypothetical protein